MSALRKLNIKATLGSKLLVTAMLVSGTATATATANDFTAEKVMKEMDATQRYAFIAGVVEGLAVARYMKDGKKSEGMNCIYDWFYDDKKTIDVIYVAFGKFSNFPPGAIIDSLTKRKCGE